MSVEGIILRPGEARTVSLGGNQFTFMVTGEDAKGASAVEFRAAPGFDSGVHVHRSVEEISLLKKSNSHSASIRLISWIFLRSISSLRAREI